jgi:hypothetical protein
VNIYREKVQKLGPWIFSVIKKSMNEVELAEETEVGGKLKSVSG